MAESQGLMEPSLMTENKTQLAVHGYTPYLLQNCGYMSLYICVPEICVCVCTAYTYACICFVYCNTLKKIQFNVSSKSFLF